MASIKKLGEKWRAQVARKGVRKSAVWDSKREATQWAERIEREIDAGLKHGRTFGTAVEHYLGTVSTEKADAEWERRRFQDFQVFFAPDTPLLEITTLEMGKWRDWRLKGDPAKKRPPVAGATVLREINLMRHLFSLARDEWKWITASPFTGLRMPEDSDPRHQLWRWQQIKRVLRADRDGKTGEVIRAFRIALATSLRLKEVLEGRYDPAKRVMVLGGGDGRTKGDGTKRIEVPLPRRAVKLLPDKFTVGANEASTLFCRLCDQLLIDDLTFHDTRATALTLLARRMDVMTLARISRHKDISLLFNTYYRESPESIARRI